MKELTTLLVIMTINSQLFAPLPRFLQKNRFPYGTPGGIETANYESLVQPRSCTARSDDPLLESQTETISNRQERSCKPGFSCQVFCCLGIACTAIIVATTLIVQSGAVNTESNSSLAD